MSSRWIPGLRDIKPHIGSNPFASQGGLRLFAGGTPRGTLPLQGESRRGIPSWAAANGCKLSTIGSNDVLGIFDYLDNRIGRSRARGVNP